MKQFFVCLLIYANLIACNRSSAPEMTIANTVETIESSAKFSVLLSTGYTPDHILLNYKKFELKYLGQTSRSENRHLFMIMNNLIKISEVADSLKTDENVLEILPFLETNP